MSVSSLSTLLENKTNAFEKPGRLPGIKHPSIIDSVKHNSSVNGSQDESEGEPHLPLPPIKQNSNSHKNEMIKAGKQKSNGPVEKYSTLKSEYSQQSLGNKVIKTKKKFNEDLKIDKAKIFKKGFLEISKNKKAKK